MALPSYDELVGEEALPSYEELTTPTTTSKPATIRSEGQGPEPRESFTEKMKAMFAPTPEAIAYGQEQFVPTTEQVEALPAQMAAQAAAQEQVIREHREPLPAIPGEENLVEPPFLSGVAGAVQEAIPQNLGAAAGMLAEGLAPAWTAGRDVIQTGRNIADLIRGKPFEEVVPPEKPFTEYTPEDWGKLTGRVGLQAAMAVPVFKGLRPHVGPPTGITVPERIKAKQAEQLRAAVKGPEPPPPAPEIAVEPTTIGEPSASEITEPASVGIQPEGEGMGRTPPLRQPRETPELRIEEEAVPGGGGAQEAQAEVAPPAAGGAGAAVTLHHATPKAFTEFSADKFTPTGLGGKGVFFNTEAQKLPYGDNVISIEVPQNKLATHAQLEAAAQAHPDVSPDIAAQREGFVGVQGPAKGDYILYNPNEFLNRPKPTTPTAGVPQEAEAAVEQPLPYTREAAEARARAAQPKAESVAEPGKAGTGEGGISIKNEYTDAQRQILKFPEAVQEARRDFGTVWEEAEATARRDPGAGARLVDAVNEGKVKALDDHGDALLLREQVRAQGEHTDAVKAVNEAATDADKTAAKARLEIARDELQAVYNADRKAGRSTAQGLNARKMLAKEDYSITAMQARKRAANNGERLNERQLKEVETLHARITELSGRIDQLSQARPTAKGDFNRLIQEGQKEAKAAVAAKKRFTDFTGEKAAKARERVAQRRREGRLYSGVDPVAVADQVIIGADHIARGVTKFADWSVHMVKEFGDTIKPFLKDLWDKARAYHGATSKVYRSPAEVRLERYKTGLAKQMVGVKAKIQRGDLTKQQRQPIALDPAAFKMKANLQRLKNEFERGVAKDAYRKMGKADKFWQHFVGIERAMKLSSPAVFEKLGLAAAVREVLSPLESAGGYAVSKVFPRLAKGTRYGAGLKTVARAEIKAKASLFTKGMKDSWENIKGKETELEAISDKYGRQPDFWYNRIGKIHAAVKAPVKRAEFVRSLEHRMDAATKAGEDINHPQVMERLATEAALDANRAIFQQNTVVSKFFSMLDRLTPAGGRVARFLFPVVKIPVNLFKELVTYHVGAPVAAAKIGRAYWKGIETLEPLAREAIIRQLTKGSVGGAAILWGYYNSEKVHDFFAHMPRYFQHTPIAMAIHEGSILQRIEHGDKEGVKDLQTMAKYDIPFMYTVTGLANALDARDPNGWRKYLYGMIQGTVVPQAVSWTAKELDKPTPFSPADKSRYRQPENIVEAVTQGIPGLREQVPTKETKPKAGKNGDDISRRMRMRTVR